MLIYHYRFCNTVYRTKESKAFPVYTGVFKHPLPTLVVYW